MGAGLGMFGQLLCAVRDIVSFCVHPNLCQLIFFSRALLQPPVQNLSQEILLLFII